MPRNRILRKGEGGCVLMNTNTSSTKQNVCIFLFDASAQCSPKEKWFTSLEPSLFSYFLYLNIHRSRVGAIPESFWKIQDGSRWAWRTRLPWKPFQALYSWPSHYTHGHMNHQNYLKAKWELSFHVYRMMWGKDWTALKNLWFGKVSWKHSITRELLLTWGKKKLVIIFLFEEHYILTHTHVEKFTLHTPSLFKNFFCITSEEYCEKELWQIKGSLVKIAAALPPLVPPVLESLSSHYNGKCLTSA